MGSLALTKMPVSGSKNIGPLSRRAKTRPVLISALASKPDVLLTLDARDFALLLNTEVYGVFVTTPRDFLIREGLG